MAPLTDSTAPPTPTPPPAPSVADLYGPQGKLVAAPPTTPAGVNHGASGSYAPPTSDDVIIPQEGAAAITKGVKKVAAVVKEPLTHAEDIPELATPVAAGKITAAYLRAHGHENAAKVVDAYTGVEEGAGDFVTAMSSPQNLAMMYSLGRLKQAGAAGAAVDRLINAKFSYDQIKGAYESIPGVKAAIDKGDYETAARAITGAASSAVMGVTAGGAALEGTPVAEAGKNFISQGAEEGKAAINAKAPAGSTEAGKIDLSDLGSKPVDARRGPESFGRTPGTKFGDTVNKTFQAERDRAAAEPEIKSEGPEWDRTHSAYVNGEKVGSVGYHLDPSGRAQIYGSNVSEDMRGQGIGQKLYKTAIADARANGADRITSDSTNTSEDANRVWEKLKDKGVPVQDIQHPNGKSGYQVDLTEPESANADIAGSQPTATSGAAPEDLTTNERQSPLKQHWKIQVQDPTTHEFHDETVDAYSSKDALKQGQKKFPGSGVWTVSGVDAARDESTAYQVPKEKLASMPEQVSGKTAEQTIRHELGHALVGLKEGMDVKGMLRHTHPDLGSNTRASVAWDARELFQPGTRKIKPEKLSSVVENMMGGIAADEAFNDVPRAANHNFTRYNIDRGSDGGQAYRFLREYFDHDEAMKYMHEKIDSAKEYLTQPAVSGIIQENAGVREPGLSKQYHYSPERLENMHAEVQRRLQNGTTGVVDNGTTGGSGNPNSETANPRGESKNTGIAAAVPAKEEVTAPTEKEPEDGEQINSQTWSEAKHKFVPRQEWLDDWFAANRAKVLKNGETISTAETNPTEEKEPDMRIGSSLPSMMKKGVETHPNPHGSENLSNLAAVKNTPGFMEKAANIAKDTPGFKPSDPSNPAAVIKDYVRHIADNVKYVYNKMSPAERAYTGQWYPVGAHNMIKDIAQTHGVTPAQVAGITAVTSPLTDWDQNISNANRVVDVWKNQQNTPFTPEMKAQAKVIAARKGMAQFKPLFKDMEGKTLSQLPHDEQAWYVRLFDEAHGDRTFQRWNPDGSSAGIAKNDSGAPTSSSWSFQSQIEKALNILKDGSKESISNAIGNGHKTRNFYNNMLYPNDPNYLTMDTHAVAVGKLLPLAGGDEQTKTNFGGIGSKQTGLKGVYALNDAGYRLAAKELGIEHPNQLQSMTWVEIRNQFPDVFKTADNKKAITKIWKEYTDGKITKDAARDKIWDFASQHNGRNAVAPEAVQNPSDQGELPAAGVRGAGAEPAAAGSGRGTTSGNPKPKVKPNLSALGKPGSKAK